MNTPIIEQRNGISHNPSVGLWRDQPQGRSIINLSVWIDHIKKFSNNLSGLP